MSVYDLLLICLTVLTLAAIWGSTHRSVSETRAQAETERESIRGAAHQAEMDARWQALADQIAVDRPAIAPARVNHRVTVHTKMPDDQTFHGVLVGDYTDRLVLEHAEYISPQGKTPIPGVQHIAKKDVAWVDVHMLVTEGDAASPAPLAQEE